MKNINSGRGFKYGALLVAVLIVGCGNEKGGETEAHSHNQEGGVTKEYVMKNGYTACPDGLSENGKVVPPDLLKEIKKVKVKIPDDAQIRKDKRSNVYYYDTIIPLDPSQGEQPVIGCSPNAEELMAWSCKKNPELDGMPCEPEVMKNLPEKWDEQHGDCKRTNVVVSDLIMECEF